MYDAHEIPNRINVEIVTGTGRKKATTVVSCLIVGQAMKWPQVIDPNGGRHEFARKTLIEAHRNNQPVRI